MHLIDIFQAYFDCRRRKRNNPEALEWEQNFESNCIQLHKEITTDEARCPTSPLASLGHDFTYVSRFILFALYERSLAGTVGFVASITGGFVVPPQHFSNLSQTIRFNSALALLNLIIFGSTILVSQIPYWFESLLISISE